MAQTKVCLIDSNEDRVNQVHLIFEFLEADAIRSHPDEALPVPAGQPVDMILLDSIIDKLPSVVKSWRQNVPAVPNILLDDSNTGVQIPGLVEECILLVLGWPGNVRELASLWNAWRSCIPMAWWMSWTSQKNSKRLSRLQVRLPSCHWHSGSSATRQRE